MHRELYVRPESKTGHNSANRRLNQRQHSVKTVLIGVKTVLIGVKQRLKSVNWYHLLPHRQRDSQKPPPAASRSCRQELSPHP